MEFYLLLGKEKTQFTTCITFSFVCVFGYLIFDFLIGVANKLR